MHFEMRAQRGSRDQMVLSALRHALTVALGIILALISASTIIVSGILRMLREDAVTAALTCSEEDGAANPCNASSAPSRALTAFTIYAGFSLALVLIAAGLTAWAPAAAGSGLPELKAFLNGCHKPEILRPRTLAAKAIGTTLVVTSGLPIGREGPMVHIGAALAVSLSSLRFPMAKGALLFEMRAPKQQQSEREDPRPATRFESQTARKLNRRKKACKSQVRRRSLRIR